MAKNRAFSSDNNLREPLPKRPPPPSAPKRPAPESQRSETVQVRKRPQGQQSLQGQQSPQSYKSPQNRQSHQGRQTPKNSKSLENPETLKASKAPKTPKARKPKAGIHVFNKQNASNVRGGNPARDGAVPPAVDAERQRNARKLSEARKKVSKMQYSSGRDEVLVRNPAPKTDKSLHYAFWFILFLIACAILSRTVIFNAEEVVVRGGSYYTADEIMASGRVQVGTTLINLNMKRIAQDIVNDLVYVDSAKVERSVFPNVITITVEDAVRQVCIYDGEYYLDISQSGRILEKSKSAPDDCLKITGYAPLRSEVGDYLLLEEDKFKITQPETDEEREEAFGVAKGKLAFRIVDLIHEFGLDDVTLVDVTNEVDTRVFVGRRPEGKRQSADREFLEIRLGSTVQLDVKFAAAVEMIAHKPPDVRGIINAASVTKANEVNRLYFLPTPQ